jgi:hypothetical protein
LCYVSKLRNFTLCVSGAHFELILPIKKNEFVSLLENQFEEIHLKDRGKYGETLKFIIKKVGSTSVIRSMAELQDEGIANILLPEHARYFLFSVQ